MIGPQVIGKTRWIHKLLSKKLTSYFYSGTLNARSKDIAIHLSECFIFNLDELEDLSANKIGVFKANSSESAIRIRRPYGRNSETLIRRASLVATVNVPKYLKDPSGSRRFLSIYTKNIDYNHFVDLDEVFSQAYELYKSGFQYWLSTEEINEIQEYNEQFIDRSDLQELIISHFIKAEATDATHLFTSSDAAKYLAEKTKKDIRSINIISLGKEFNRLGFLTKKTKGVKAYLLKTT